MGSVSAVVIDQIGRLLCEYAEKESVISTLACAARTFRAAQDLVTRQIIWRCHGRHSQPPCIKTARAWRQRDQNLAARRDASHIRESRLA